MSGDGPVFELRVALRVEDFDRAVAFWRDALGLPLTRSWEKPEGKGALLAAGRATIELLSAGEADVVDEVETEKRMGAPLRLALEVADSATAAHRLEAAGAGRLGDVVETPWGHRSIRLETPEGIQLTLFADLNK